MMFRVATLRNADKTAPYFHDGKTAKLEEAVDKMAWHQLGRRLSPDDVKALVAFLSSLAGELPAGLIAEPKLPRAPTGRPRPIRRSAAVEPRRAASRSRPLTR